MSQRSRVIRLHDGCPIFLNIYKSIGEGGCSIDEAVVILHEKMVGFEHNEKAHLTFPLN